MSKKQKVQGPQKKVRFNLALTEDDDAALRRLVRDGKHATRHDAIRHAIRTVAGRGREKKAKATA